MRDDGTQAVPRDLVLACMLCLRHGRSNPVLVRASLIGPIPHGAMTCDRWISDDVKLMTSSIAGAHGA